MPAPNGIGICCGAAGYPGLLCTGGGADGDGYPGFCCLFEVAPEPYKKYVKWNKKKQNMTKKKPRDNYVGIKKPLNVIS